MTFYQGWVYKPPQVDQDILKWYILKRDHYMLHGVIDPNMLHSMSRDVCDDTDSRVFTTCHTMPQTQTWYILYQEMYMMMWTQTCIIIQHHMLQVVNDNLTDIQVTMATSKRQDNKKCINYGRYKCQSHIHACHM